MPFTTSNSKTPRSADAILASYLEQQVKSQASANQKRTNLKAAYKLPLSALDCRNLMNNSRERHSNSMSGEQQTRTSSSFFPHLLDESATNGQHPADLSSSIVQIQRKFLALFYIYVIIIVSLYLTYAVYCYYQQNSFNKNQPSVKQTLASTNQASSPLIAAPSSSADEITSGGDQLRELQLKMENKIHLLERYVEALALDLESAKWRLSEREKCACSIGCSFNGTKFADQQTWRSKCDICKCSAGKISCQPRECPKLSCQNQPGAVILTLPGQCCPTCMKQCKVNGMLVRHSHSFKPMDVASGQQASGKQCKCFNGLIKCEQARNHSPNQQFLNQQPIATNKTLEYLKSILGSKFALQVNAKVASATL